MKAVVLNAPGELTFDDVERPAYGAGEVLVRVTHNGVCGTDLKIYQGAIPVRYPRVMGHEMVGRVVEGGDVAGLAPDTRVIIDPMIVCRTCFHCQGNQPHLCPNGTLLGRDRDGGFAEYVAVPATNLHRLPDMVGDREAPVIQVLTTCLHAQRLAPIFPSQSVVVLGLGVTGQLHVQLAKARGAYPVIGVTRSAWKRELALKLGADLALDAGEGTRTQVLEATQGRGADLVIECVGKVSVLAQAVELARIGGRLLVFGVTTEKEGALPFYQLYFKELDVINARAARAEDYPPSIDLVRRGVVNIAPLVSHSLGLDALGTALNLISGGDGGAMKVILENTP